MREKIIMVYPKVGFNGNFVKHTPLSLLYASIELIKHGIEVEILDNRLFPTSWKGELKKHLTPEVLVVGISVMSGSPIENAIEVGRFVKKIDPEIKVVWGGPHATFYSETILQESSCDYVVSGYGSKSFYELIRCIMKGKEPSEINGIYYRKNDQIAGIPYEKKFEIVNYREIPYHLIKNYTVYGHLEEKEIVFSIYSVMGCPYKCAFCSSPAQFKEFDRRWQSLEINEVVNHIEYVVKEYGAGFIYFIDDDSFVKLSNVEDIIDEINRRNINVKLGFRGARINEIKKMSNEFLDKLAAAGTDVMHVGAECGSDRILKLIRKNCLIKDILECNKKLARHPQIKIYYNFIVGIPTETLDEVKSTRDLMLKLVEDNPSCMVFYPNKFIPLQGTELFDLAIKEWGYTPPKNLTDWINIEAENSLSSPWYPKYVKEFADLMFITSFFIDNKIFKVASGDSLFYKLLRLISIIYKPVASFRLKHGIYQGLIELRLYKIASRWLSNRNI